jgi:hypothetical protein
MRKLLIAITVTSLVAVAISLGLRVIHERNEEKNETANQKTIEIALNDHQVEEWLDKGYYKDEIVVNQVQYAGSETSAEVVIPTKRQDPPWASEITVEAYIDWSGTKVNNVQVDAQLASLTEEQKQEVVEIALADRRVAESVGGVDIHGAKWSVGSVEVRRYGDPSFFALPSVEIYVVWPVPLPDNSSGEYVYVDLAKKTVTMIRGWIS